MPEPEQTALVSFRLQKAEADLLAAKQNYAMDLLDAAANRSYYAIFHAARAVLALHQQDYKKHAGVIAFFRRDFVKTGIFEKRMSDVIQNAFDIRTECDYEDFFTVTQEEVKSQIDDAAYFIGEIKSYVAEFLSSDHP